MSSNYGCICSCMDNMSNHSSRMITVVGVLHHRDPVLLIVKQSRIVGPQRYIFFIEAMIALRAARKNSHNVSVTFTAYW